MNKHSPILYSYLKKYQREPQSRVFAPLAEAYRKAGLIDEAIEIASEGVRIHPNFAGGRVALARALFEKKRFDSVIEELRPVIQEVPDNLVAQRLFGDSSLMLGRMAEALSAYKMLLYFNPTDSEIAKMVFELESQAYDKGAMVLERKQSLGGGKDGPMIFSGDKQSWMKRIETLQTLLQRVSDYRAASPARE